MTLAVDGMLNKKHNNKASVYTIFSGCGPLPNITNIRWECEEDYSRQVHGVYFPCQGYCNITGEVQFHAYCNTGLLWEVTKVHSGTCKGKLIHSLVGGIHFDMIE